MIPEIEERYESVMARVNKLETSYDMLTERETDLEQEIENLQNEKIVLEKVAALFKHLLNQYVYQYAESFSEIVTEGLQSIYHDQDVRFDIEVEQKYGKVNAVFLTEQNGMRGNPLEAFGGGVSAVESLLLRILVLLKAGLARYLILDESLGALSTEYVDNCGSFLRKLCDEMDVNILLVTHNEDFLDQCDTAYMGSANNNGRLQLKKIR